MPSRGNAHVDRLLTRYGVGYDNKDFYGPQLAPLAGVPNQTDKYPIWGKEAWRLRLDDASPKGGGTEVDFEYSNTNFVCEGHMQTHFVPAANDEDRPPFNELQTATDTVMQGIQRNLDNHIFAAITDTSVVTQTDAAGTAWDDGSVTIGTIVEEFEGNKDVVQLACGHRPNVLVIKPAAWNAFRAAPAFTDAIKYTQRGVLTTELFASLLDVDRVIVPRTLYDSVDEGQTASGAFMWPAACHALLCYVAPNNGGNMHVPSFARTFVWTGAPGAIEGVQIQTANVAPGVVAGRGTHGGTEVIATMYYKTVVQAASAATRLTGLYT